MLAENYDFYYNEVIDLSLEQMEYELMAWILYFQFQFTYLSAKLKSALISWFFPSGVYDILFELNSKRII